MVQVQLLGTFQVIRGDEIVTPSAPKVRRVLALLAMRANSVVHIRQLIEELWEERPPLSSSTTLQTYIYQLRRMQGLVDDPAGGTRGASLLTSPGGYQLNLPDGALDVHTFEELARRGRAQMERGFVEGASDVLREALAVWRGPALSDITAGPILHVDTLRLEESRNSVLEQRIDADLMLGRHNQLISELTGHAAHNPTHEGLHAKLMLALYRAGRRSESLSVFHRIRRVLAAELGLEPCSELQRLHQSVLSSDPKLDLPSGGAGTVQVSRAVEPPMHLPPDSALTGRSAEVAAMEQLLTKDSGPSPFTLSVTGPPGSGTSALCAHVAHRVRGRFPDGQLYASLGDPDDTDEPAEVLGDFLRAVGFTGSAVPDGLEDRIRLFRGWTADRRVLVTVDNVASSAQLGPLLPSGRNCATVVASHRRLCDRSTSAVLDLRPLAEKAAMDLLASVVGDERIGRETAAAQRLTELCGGLPVALRAAANKLALRPHWPLRRLVDKLHPEHRRLHELRGGDLDVLCSVERRYMLLRPELRSAFRALVRLSDAPITAEVAALMLGTDEYTAETLLEELVEFHLAEVDARQPADPFLYSFLPLVRLAVHSVSGWTVSASLGEGALACEEAGPAA